VTLMDDVEAKALSLLATMRQGKRYHKSGTLPGDGAPFLWQVLTRGEKQDCLAAALRRFEELGIPAELRSYHDLEDEVTVQVLCRAMRDPEDASRAFAASADLATGYKTVVIVASHYVIA